MATPSLKKGTSNSDLLNRTVTTNSNPARAFYELPEGASTSAQIVKESRDWLRSVSTCRPFTPKDKTRSLLNTLQTRTGYRPPSAFKVTAKSFDPYETTTKSNIQLEPIHIKEKNVQKPSKLSKIEMKLNAKRKSKNLDDRIQVRHSATPSQSSGSMEESVLTDSHKNSPRLELIGTQTRLISPISVKRPVCSVIKSERCTAPKSPYGNCTELQMMSTNQKHLQNTQMEINKNKDIISKINSILPENHSASNKITTKISAYPYYLGPPELSTLSSIDDNQSFRPNSPVDSFLLSNRTILTAEEEEEEEEEDKHQFRSNGIRSDVAGTNTNGEFTKLIVDENKPKSCGPHKRSANYDVTNINLRDKFQTSVSRDSGLSSVTELDNLIYQLNELLLSTSTIETEILVSSPSSPCANLQNSKTFDSQLLFKDNNNSSVQEQYQKLNEVKNKVTPSTRSIKQEEEENVHSNLITNKLNENEVTDLLDRIQNCISEFNLEGNRNWPNRSMLLKAVFNLINYPSSRIHLAVARLIFTMKITGKNLLNICKIVYKVAKNADNDCLFLENPNTLDVLIDALHLLELSIMPFSISSSVAYPSTVPVTSSLSPKSFSMNNLFQNSTLFCIHLESLLFLTGTIKFLISNINFMPKFHSNSSFLPNLMTIHKHIYEMLIYFLKNKKYFCSVITAKKEEQHNSNDENDGANNNDVYGNQISKFIQHAYHIIIQVTEIFCYLSSMDLFRPKLIANDGILQHIVNCIISYEESDDKMLRKSDGTLTTSACITTDNHDDQSEMEFNFSEFYTIYFNWIRCLSHLTEHADVCHYLENWLVPSNKDMNINLTTNMKPNDSINICHILSTQITALCYALTDFIYIFEEKHELVVRIAYVLGNLAAKCERARIAVIHNQDSLLKLCNLCYRYNEIQKLIHQSDHYTNRINLNKLKSCTEFNNTDFLNNALTDKLNKSVKSTYSLQYDILVKLLRVIANVSISNTVGLICTSNFDCINLILEIIDNQSIGEPNELLLNCFACLNNLTYYIKQELTDQSVIKQCEIAESLLRVIMKTSGFQDEFLGIIRVFGNLTRHTAIRQWLTNNSSRLLQVKYFSPFNDINPISSNNSNITELNNLIQQNAFLYLVIQALDSPRPDILYSTLGVLINLMTDLDQRPMLRIMGGLSKLVKILRDFAGHDWELAGLTCKTLWNYTEVVGNSQGEMFDQELMDELLSLLTKFTDDELIAQIHKSLLSNSLVAESDCLLLWESTWSSEFLPFANELIYRLSNASQ
ncbi:unnamed protein product [Schistosoma margrebowiei]|uniref:Armadillo repeat-containing domain-containing protein n=2 Tax=Schistosoma margrebowiei TaxID=48269 RepID=A0AA84ZXW5_9TREM|nr:unnamed protein product [Schistosoma margrebowiei]